MITCGKQLIHIGIHTLSSWHRDLSAKTANLAQSQDYLINFFWLFTLVSSFEFARSLKIWRKLCTPMLMLEEKMTNCPKCNRPILNGGLFTSPARFTIRCPWCQATLQINIQPKIVTEVVKIGNGHLQTSSGPMGGSSSPADLYAPASLYPGAIIDGFQKPSSLEREISQKVQIMGKTYKFVGHLYPDE